MFLKEKIPGSCLCGSVRFEVEPPFLRAGHCHCERCRKHSGTAVCTQARVPKEQFTLLQGAKLIRVYGKTEGAVKAFCRNCGSSLFGGDWPDGDEVSIRMGAFDSDPGIRPQFHTWVSDRAARTQLQMVCRNTRKVCGAEHAQVTPAPIPTCAMPIFVMSSD